MIKRHINYLRYVMRHKAAVWSGGRFVGGIPIWRLLIHDWDKFMPDEWFPYAAAFYAPDGSSQYIESAAMAQAWNAHQKRNRHHWQYWLLTWDRGETTPIPMPEADAREMVADWIGAGKAITGNPDPTEWYEKNKNKMTLHPDTRQLVERLLDDVRGFLTMPIAQ